jgi:hypothetical protein
LACAALYADLLAGRGRRARDPAAQGLFQKYGKVPAQKNLLANKLKVRPFRIQLPTSVW